MAFRAASAARKVVAYSEKGVFEVRSYNNLTVALDTVRHQYVCAPTDPADPGMNQLRRASCSGDRTLVCALCYAGISAAPGTRVPVVVKGRIRGDRRPHFAHPPGRGPAGGGHEPESVWHLASKASLEPWARTQPGVIDVRNEVWLPTRERRCDVRVVFADGSYVAVEGALREHSAYVRTSPGLRTYSSRSRSGNQPGGDASDIAVVADRLLRMCLDLSWPARISLLRNVTARRRARQRCKELRRS